MLEGSGILIGAQDPPVPSVQTSEMRGCLNWRKPKVSLVPVIAIFVMNSSFFVVRVRIVLTVAEVVVEGLVEIVRRDDVRRTGTVLQVQDEVAEAVAGYRHIHAGQRRFIRISGILNDRLPLRVLV